MDETAQATAQAAESKNGAAPVASELTPEAAQILAELAELRLRLQATQAALGIVVGINVMVLLAVILATRKITAASA